MFRVDHHVLTLRYGHGNGPDPRVSIQTRRLRTKRRRQGATLHPESITHGVHLHMSLSHVLT